MLRGDRRAPDPRRANVQCGVHRPRRHRGTLGANELAEIGLATLGPLSIYQPAYEAAGRPRPKALVTITKGGRPGLALFNAESFLHPYGVPTVLVSSRDGAARRGGGAARGDQVRVVAEGAAGAHPLVRNVVATVGRAERTGDRSLAVMTPRSGWWHCTSETAEVAWSAGWRFCGRVQGQAALRRRDTGGLERARTRPYRPGRLHGTRQPNLVTGADWLHFRPTLRAPGTAG